MSDPLGKGSAVGGPRETSANYAWPDQVNPPAVLRQYSRQSVGPIQRYDHALTIEELTVAMCGPYHIHNSCGCSDDGNGHRIVSRIGCVNKLCDARDSRRGSVLWAGKNCQGIDTAQGPDYPVIR